jgi:hypothetical protein
MDWELLVVDQSGVRLRSAQICSHRWMHWTIFAINVVLRYCWTLSFLPPHYLNKAGVLSKTFEDDISGVFFSTIALAEIVSLTKRKVKVKLFHNRVTAYWSRNHSQLTMDVNT